MNTKSVSVAMAAYNGEQYIGDQIDSILYQLKRDDELVISLDASLDRTDQIVREKCKKDKRIILIDGPNQGAISNFENAINIANKDIIFLADQDDYWLPGKVENVLKAFDDTDVKVVLHDASIVDKNLNVIIPSYFQHRKVRKGIKENILKNSYMGCCMAFRQELKEVILPFPKDIPMHDQWIGLVGELTGKTIFLPQQYLLYRRHEANETDLKHSNILQMIKWRKNIYTEIEKIKKNIKPD